MKLYWFVWMDTYEKVEFIEVIVQLRQYIQNSTYTQMIPNLCT